MEFGLYLDYRLGNCKLHIFYLLKDNHSLEESVPFLSDDELFHREFSNETK